jgi:2-octaprenyl-6-methoxyphenol hydroxylase
MSSCDSPAYNTVLAAALSSTQDYGFSRRHGESRGKEIAMAQLNDHYDIAISGASYAGLALALATVRTFGADLKVAVIERSAVTTSSNLVQMPPSPRAFALSAGSRRMLQTLGVWELIATDAEPVTAIDITDSSLDAGVRPIILSYDNTVEGGEPATHIVPANSVLKALLDRVANEPNITILAPDEVHSFEATAASARIRLVSGREVTATLGVAADGRNSALRDLAGIKSVTRSYEQTGIVTIVAHEKPHNGRAVQHFLPSGPFAILPLRGNRSCITWSESDGEARRILALDDQAFLDEIDQRFGGRLGAITLEGRRQSWSLDLHLARTYTALRLAVIGDAAHAVHPIAGQGMNLGLRDAAALIDAIAEAARLGVDIGSSFVLERYQSWRHFDATVSAAAFDGLNRLFSNDNTVLRAVRDAGLGVVDRTPYLKDLFVREAAGLNGELPRLFKGEPV